MKDAVATMGDVLPDDAGGRDAVHVAVFSAVASETLSPGDHVGISINDGPDISVSQWEAPIGIVDPFIPNKVKPGERFWVYLYPRTITGLSHKWDHPAFGEQASGEFYSTPNAKLEAERFLRDYCQDDFDTPSYDTLIRYAKDYACGGDDHEQGVYLFIGGEDASGPVPREVWDKIEIVIGMTAEAPEYFSCSC